MSTTRVKTEQETKFRREGEVAPKDVEPKSQWRFAGFVVFVIMFVIIAVLLLSRMFRNRNYGDKTTTKTKIKEN
jgi:flagellar biogenesis protein FliO